MAEDSRLAGLEVAPEAGAVLVAQARRDDDLGHLAADDLFGPIAERLLGGGIELEDASAVVDRDDAWARFLSRLRL